MRQGAWYKDNGVTEFVLWAPFRESVKLKIISPETRTVVMVPLERGYWHALVEGVPEGSRYLYILDNSIERPDPASFFQPEGVHGPSEVVNHKRFEWNDDGWAPPSLEDMIIYELHIGTFTEEGTFDSAIEKLDYLNELGITMVEIMPVAQFSGSRNWGYDGVYPYAVQNSYGGPEDLKRFVNACHQRGIGVILDVVYNHLGPEGNYLRDFGPYFTDLYRTPWGEAINLDGPYSDEVRAFFINNAIYWMEYFHIDGLRLDATHAIFDQRPEHFLSELKRKTSERAKSLKRRFYLFAETNLNDPKLIRPPSRGGYGLDAMWNEDFHHSIHSLLTGQRDGYYVDYGDIEHLLRCVNDGFTYTGQYSEFRKRAHGGPVNDIEYHRFVGFLQNHDQTGNRPLGERLSCLVSFEALKSSAVLLFFCPFVPLLFMGEEYGEDNPFFYFVDHQDKELIKAVREGRRKEFEGFQWPEMIPEPDDPETFLRSKLNWAKLQNRKHRALYELYRHLISLRKTEPALKNGLRGFTGAEEDTKKKKLLYITRTSSDRSSRLLGVFNLKPQEEEFYVPETLRAILSSEERRWEGQREVPPQGTSDIILLPYEAVVFRLL
ncbi:MAG: malto-oligosyltrehalose trehalohydrolase [Nitrospirae bacterium]|nr:MAG: malto-oligosyltrehalose trehalohydrolase [Nitrospirota bacterium]